MNDVIENFSRAFAPEWISNDLGLDIDDFESYLSEIDINMDDGFQGWVFEKCKSDFDILKSIVTEK